MVGPTYFVLRRFIGSRLINDNVPFQKIQSKHFKKMFHGVLRDFKPMARQTFESYVENDFDKFVMSVKNLFEKEVESFLGIILTDRVA